MASCNNFLRCFVCCERRTAQTAKGTMRKGLVAKRAPSTALERAGLMVSLTCRIQAWYSDEDKLCSGDVVKLELWSGLQSNLKSNPPLTARCGTMAIRRRCGDCCSVSDSVTDASCSVGWTTHLVDGIILPKPTTLTAIAWGCSCGDCGACVCAWGCCCNRGCCSCCSSSFLLMAFASLITTPTPVESVAVVVGSWLRMLIALTGTVCFVRLPRPGVTPKRVE